MRAKQGHSEFCEATTPARVHHRYRIGAEHRWILSYRAAVEFTETSPQQNNAGEGLKDLIAMAKRIL